MPGGLGTISGQVRLDVSQAIAAFAAMRAASAATTGALGAAATGLTKFGMATTAIGLGMVAAFGVAVNAAADFEKKMDYFGAVNNATAQEMEKVRAKALELGRDGQFSAGQIADAFVEMGKAGVSVTDITDGMAQAVVNLASAADIKLDEATNIVTSQIQSYGLAAKDAAHVTDELAGAANASIVDVSDLGVSLKYVGGVAHAVGIDFDSTTDALSLLGKAGLKGSTAGTSLRQIIVSLSGATKPAHEQLEKLGIITSDGGNKFFDAQGKAKSLAEVFQILQDHTRGLTQEQQLMAFRTIFNNRALAAAEVLTKAGAKGFAEMNAEITKTSAAEVAGKRLDNLSGDLKKLKGAFDTLMIEAGSPFQEFLRKIVQHLTSLIGAFMRLSPEMQRGIMMFLGIGGAILVFVGSVALMAGTILKVASVFSRFAAAIRLVATVMKVLTIATIEQTAAALANPYVLLAIAVVALVAGLIILYKKSEAFHNFINAIGSGLKAGFLATVEWFKGLPKFFEDIWKDIRNWFTAGVEWVKAKWEYLGAMFTAVGKAVVDGAAKLGNSILDFFKAIPGQVTSFLSDAWTGFVHFLEKLPFYVGYTIGFILGSIVRFAIDAAKWFWDLGGQIVDAVTWAFTDLPGIVYKYLLDLAGRIAAWTVETYHAFLSWVTDTYNSIIEWFSKLPGEIADWFTRTKDRAIAVTKEFTADVVAWGINTWNAIVNWVTRLPGEVYNWFLVMTWKIGNALSDAYNTALKFGSDVYRGIIDWVSKIPGKVWDLINDTIRAFKDMVASAIAATKDFAGGLWKGFKDGLGIKSPSYIERAMWAITKVTDTETKRLGKHVQQMQELAGSIAQDNPAKAAADMNTAQIVALTAGMQQQADLLNRAALSLTPTYGFGAASSDSTGSTDSTGASLTALGIGQSKSDITVNVYNPQAETASDSTSRKLRTLTAMGAF